MGITVIQKSNLSTRKRNPRLALVLAGGAVSGGAFKLGGLKALDDLMVNRKTVDFDTYVGLSAGAFIAAPLAAGISTDEMLSSLQRTDDSLGEGLGTGLEFRLSDFYFPNVAEFVTKPIDFVADLVSYFPRVFGDFLLKSPETLQRLQEPVARYFDDPSFEHLGEVAQPIVDAFVTQRRFPFFLDYLPSGLFDNRRIERFIRRNYESRGLANDFRALYRERGKELYIVAMNLDTAERVVFGHDEDCALTISEAVQATTALPGFYKPARIKGVDYIDGGVRRTANLDVAIEHGADLIICYNPFRPFNNPVRPGENRRGQPGTPLADHGMLAVMNQVFRSLLHSRLHHGLHQYREDPNFTGDIILIEPTDTDDTFFKMFPLNFWERRRAAEHGYLSVTRSIEANYETIRRVLDRYGLLLTKRKVREGVERIRETARADHATVRELPRASAESA
jgi:predicted acylesterase/phospholipase RssA